MKNLVIAIRGAQCEKIVNGQRKQVVPFVGADREGEFAQMGIGLIFPDEENGTIWGLLSPHVLIQSWRGMRILEKIETINHGTICACWTVARKNIHESDKRHLEELALQLGDDDKLQAFLDEVLVSVPSTDEINTMITNFRERGVDVDSWELDEEVKAGRISTSPLIEMLARETEERRRAYQREEEEVKKPLAHEESLTAFFEDLGIANFIIGGGIGGYGMDWGHIKLDELDNIVKRDSFNEYSAKEYCLEHTTEGPETLSAEISPDVTMHQTSFGKIEQPHYTADDGKEYTFLSARWESGRFYIRTLIDQSEETTPEEVTCFTIGQLRSMIGPIPQRPVARRTFMQKLASLFQ